MGKVAAIFLCAIFVILASSMLCSLGELQEAWVIGWSHIMSAFLLFILSLIAALGD